MTLVIIGLNWTVMREDEQESLNWVLAQIVFYSIHYYYDTQYTIHYSIPYTQYTQPTVYCLSKSNSAHWGPSPERAGYAGQLPNSEWAVYIVNRVLSSV